VKFKYLIVSVCDGEAQGTNDEVVASDLRRSDDYYVIDCERQVWLVDGAELAIQEFKL
jgi:hypothetical protein